MCVDLAICLGRYVRLHSFCHFHDTFSSGMDEIVVVISIQSILLFVRISHAVKIEIKQQFNTLEYYKFMEL
jgi:hypothetical protein